MGDVKQLEPPDSTDSSWKTNCMQTWPPITWADIYNYLVESKAYDHKSLKAFRSLEAHNYVMNGWVGDILNCVSDDGTHYLKAEVSPSQLGEKNPYTAWVAAKSDGTVLTASCKCPAGLGRACSHVAAILFAVYLVWQKGLIGESCTDITVTWGKGTKRTVSPSRMQDINFQKPKLKLPSPKKPKSMKNLFPIEQYYSDNDLKIAMNDSILNSLVNCPGTLLNKTLSCKLSAVDDTILKSKNNLPEHGNHENDYSQPINLTFLKCKICKEFYQKYVHLNPSKLAELQIKTSDQTGDFWHEPRKIRVTASRANSVPKTEKGKACNFIKTNLYPTFRGNKNTEYGKNHEETARQDFERIYSKKVSKTGLVISKEDPWLAASPDGICDSSQLLEIKCPVKNVGELIKSGKYDVKSKDGELFLYEKGPNGYFYQVQIGMYCLNFQECLMFVWSEGNDKIFLNVDRDMKFLNNHVPRLRKFYFEQMLPVIVDHFNIGKFKLSKRFKDFCTS